MDVITIAGRRDAFTGADTTTAIISTDRTCAGNTAATGTIMIGEITITGEIIADGAADK